MKFQGSLQGQHHRVPERVQGQPRGLRQHGPSDPAPTRRVYHSVSFRSQSNENLQHLSLPEAEQIIIPRTLTSEVLAAIQSVRFIAQHIKDSDRDNEVSRLRNGCGK